MSGVKLKMDGPVPKKKINLLSVRGFLAVEMVTLKAMKNVMIITEDLLMVVMKIAKLKMDGLVQDQEIPLQFVLTTLHLQAFVEMENMNQTMGNSVTMETQITIMVVVTLAKSILAGNARKTFLGLSPSAHIFVGMENMSHLLERIAMMETLIQMMVAINVELKMDGAVQA